MMLDLDMGYYHIELSPSSKCLCTIVMPFGKYKYQHLPMGLCNSPEIFQECMLYEIFSYLKYVRVYIDDLLVMSCSTFEEHLQRWALKLIFSWLSEAGLKVNANKSHFAVSEIAYLGNWKMVSNQYIKKWKQFNALLLWLLTHKFDPLLDSSITIETCGLEDQKF
jgi:hypothetical protein